MKFFQHKALAAVLLFLIFFLAYSPSLKNGFVWDEAEVIQKYHHKFKVSKINKILIPKKIENKKQRYYRSLVFASIVSDREIWGISPFGYHLSNIIFNSTTTVLLYSNDFFFSYNNQIWKLENQKLLNIWSIY